MQPILAALSPSTAERAPSKRKEAEPSRDFETHLAERAERTERKERPEQKPERGPHKKLPREQEEEPTLKTEIRPEAVAMASSTPLVLDPLLQDLQVLLPEAPEIPENIEISVKMGVMPAGPRLRLDKAPPETTEMPKIPEAEETVVQAAPEAPLEAPPPPMEPGFLAPEEGEKEASPHLLQSHSENVPLMEAKPQESVAAPVEKAEVPELAAPLPQGLNLEIRDPGGRWELGVVRAENTVHLEFHGDPELRKIVQENSQEIGQRLARHGDSLGSVVWRPIASTSGAQDGRMEGGDRHPSDRQPQQQQQQSERERQDSPPSPPKRTVTSRKALRVI
jgi:hypothetical protein